MNPEEEEELIKAWKEVLEHIHSLETMKNSLALRKDFNIYNAFAIFDVENKGAINIQQLERGFQNLGIVCTKENIALLIKRLDPDLDGLVKFEDFANMTAPKTAEFARLIDSRQPYYINELESVQEAFTSETLEAFKGFLRYLVEEEALCEAIRQRLSKRKSFNLHDAFYAINRDGNEFVKADNFKCLLEENGLFFSIKDIGVLVERYAKGTEGKVSYYDFVREMTPKSVNKH